MAIEPRKLQRTEAEEFVLPDGTSGSKAILVLVIARLGIGGVWLTLTRNAIQGVETGTGVEFPHIPVILVRAGLGDQIDHRTTRTPVFCRCRISEGSYALIRIRNLDVKCLAPNADIVDVLAVHHKVVAARARSIHLNLIEVATDTAEPKILVYDLNARHCLQQLD